MSTSSRSLRIAINCQILSQKGIGGFETVLIGLIHALGKLDGPEQYVLVGPHENAERLEQYAGFSQCIVRGPGPDLAKRALAPVRPIWHQARRMLLRTTGIAPMWRAVQKSHGFYEALDCDVIHFPTLEVVKCDIPAVFTIHDLQHLHYPEFFGAEGVIWREKIFRTGCKLANSIVAISEFVKQDILDQYHLDAQRIEVIHWAPPTQVHAAPEHAFIDRVMRQYSLNEPFAFFPAVTRKHKNHIRLLEAVSILKERHGLKLRIVCSGTLDDFWPTIERRLIELKLRDHVTFLGMIASDELRALYRLAEFVIFPSLFEGAGMPLLEAWQDNAAVTCSNVTSLPEMAGDAALFFDPLSSESIANALLKMHKDAELREDLRRRGALRLQNFSWERTAKQYRAVYRRAAGRQLNDEDKEILFSHRREVAICESV